jgi:hypothetical protein
VAEPRNPTQPKLRDRQMFKASLRKGKGEHKSNALEGRPYPKVSELLMSHMLGTASEKLAWLQKEKAAGRLDGDDPDEVAEAEALLQMMARLSLSKTRQQEKQHIDELLDRGLEATFPASDPVSVGHFTGTEFR